MTGDRDARLPPRRARGIRAPVLPKAGGGRIAADEAREGAEDFCTIERRILGFDHQDVGAGLTARWRFPRSCQFVAGYHHRPRALADRGRQLIALVHVADTLCCAAHFGFDLTARTQAIDDDALAGMRIDGRVVTAIEQRLGSLVSDAIAVLGQG